VIGGAGTDRRALIFIPHAGPCDDTLCQPPFARKRASQERRDVIRSHTDMDQPSARPLTAQQADRMTLWWRAANYLSVGQIYLLANPLLREKLRIEHEQYIVRVGADMLEVVAWPWLAQA
jgi:hypothetical protein